LLAGTHAVEEAGATMGGEGRGANRWWGGMRRSRKRRLSAGEVWGRGGRDAMSGDMRSGDAGLGGVGSGVAGSIGRRRVGRRGVGSRGVGRAAWGRAGGAGSGGRDGHTRDRSVESLCLGDGSLVHHPR
jgi:hypothetical protein